MGIGGDPQGFGPGDGGGALPAQNKNLQVEPKNVEGLEKGTDGNAFRPSDFTGSALAVTQDILKINQGIEDLKSGRKSNRANKRAAGKMAERARLAFEQRGKLAERVLARQRAQFAGAGVAPGGTQAAVQDFTSLQRSLERRLILNDAFDAANAFRREGRRRYKAGKRRAYYDIGSGVGDFIARAADEIKRIDFGDSGDSDADTDT